MKYYHRYYQLTIVCILFQTAKQVQTESNSVNYIVNQQNLSTKIRCHLNIGILMNFLYGNQCVQIISDINKRFPVNCIADILKSSENITVFTRNFKWMNNRSIYKEEILHKTLENMSIRFCENYLIFVKSVQSITSIITTQDPKNTTKNFYPFSKIYFIVENFIYSPNVLKQISNVFHNRSLFGYIFEFNSLKNTFIGLRDLLTLNYTIVNDYRKTNLIHPFVDKKNTKKVFRISFHECYPYVLYTDEENLRFDGTEYRLVEEVIKNWNVEYIFRDWSKTNSSPYVTMYDDLENHIADIAMCAVWLSEHDYKFDLTTFHSHECHTMLVPKPTKFNPMTAIYTTLSYPVWTAFGVSFLVTAFLLWGIAKTKLISKNRYDSLVTTFLDIANVATSHGIAHFPEQKSVKILLFSWILLSFWIGISYSTIYTSRLTSPGFTKIIDTLEDFLSNGLYWGTHFLYPDIGASLMLSSNPAYHRLHDGIKIFKNRSDGESQLKSGKCCVLGGISRNKYLISYDWNKELTLFTSFRLMKKICILNYYSIFPLQKFSPYTELFSEQALRYQEHGFSEYWYSVIYREKRWYETFFEDYPKPDNEPKPLKIQSIIGALLILFTNCILAIFVFILEVLSENLGLRNF